MNCAQCFERKYDYLDDNVDDQTRRAIEIHMAECESCQLGLTEAEAGIAIYRDWGIVVEPSAQFTNMVLAQLTGWQPAMAYRLLRVVGLGLISVMAMLTSS